MWGTFPFKVRDLWIQCSCRNNLRGEVHRHGRHITRSGFWPLCSEFLSVLVTIFTLSCQIWGTTPRGRQRVRHLSFFLLRDEFLFSEAIPHPRPENFPLPLCWLNSGYLPFLLRQVSVWLKEGGCLTCHLWGRVEACLMLSRHCTYQAPGT